MTFTFLSQQWLAFWRAPNKGKSFAMRIVMGILILYLLLNVLVVAFFMDTILTKTHPGQDLLQTFNSFILYYFLIDLMMRFQLQELPTLSVRPYLHLPISKNQIVNYLSITSLGTAFNLTPFLLTIPFLVKTLIPQHGPGAFWGCLTLIFSLTMFNHFFSLWLKRKVNLNAVWMLAFFGLLLAIWAFEFYFKLISLSVISRNLFDVIISQPFTSLAGILIALSMFSINHNYLKSNLYLEELQSSKTAARSSTEIPYLDKFGAVGDLAANELKLIWRNKRPRSVLNMCVIFMLYGLIFYTNSRYNGYWHIVLCGMFMTGVFIIHYGQFMFSWQSAHFDGILSSKVQVEDFFKSKFLLFDVFSTCCLLLTIPYVYFGWKILAIHFVMYLWNLGINTVLVLYFANQNYKRIDLSKGGSFNWEGVGASQWLLSVPLSLAPFVVYLPLSYLGYPEIAFAAIAIIGCLFIFSREFWIKKLITVFNIKRYAIAEGFRKQ